MSKAASSPPLMVKWRVPPRASGRANRCTCHFWYGLFSPYLLCCCCCCFSHSAHWLSTRKKLLYMVANPARGLLNRRKKRRKKKSGSASPPHPRAARSEKNNNNKRITWRIHMSKRYASRRYAGGLGPSRVRTRIPTTRRLGQWVSLRKILRFRVGLQLSQSRCLVASLFSWRCLAASPSSSLHAAMNLRPPSVTASIQTSAFNAIVFQSPVMPNARMSLCTQSVHSFSFPTRPLRTAPSRFPNMSRFDNRPPLIRRSVPAHKGLLVRNVVSMLSHRVISSAQLYEVIRWSGVLRCAPMMRSKTR